VSACAWYKNHQRGRITAVRIVFLYSDLCVCVCVCVCVSSPLLQWRLSTPYARASRPSRNRFRREKPQTPNSYMRIDGNRCPERLQRRRRRRLKFPSHTVTPARSFHGLPPESFCEIIILYFIETHGRREQLIFFFYIKNMNYIFSYCLLIIIFSKLSLS